MLKSFFTTVFVLALAGGCSDDSNGGPTPDTGGGKADKGGGAGDAPKSCSATPLLPADNAVGDFAQDGSPQQARDLTELTALINGGAEKYTQTNKFACMAWVKYKSGTQSHTLEVRLFDETDQAGADAAYQATQNPDDQDITPAIGDAARGHENVVSGIYQADMRKGQYLARIIADQTAGEYDALEMLRAIAGAIN